MTTTQKAPTKLETEAMSLFSVKTADAIGSCLYALGLRATCTRCLGSGHYSRNSMGDTRCYKCGGRKEFAAKLTRPVLEQARVKVEAGELEALRERARARKAAKALVGPKVEAGRAVYMEIGAAYEAAYQAGTLRVNGALFRAQDLNNSLFWGECPSRAFKRAPARGMRTVQSDVQEGRIDALKAVAELDALHAMLVALRDAWRAWNAAAPARMRAASHARLAA